MVLFSEKKKPTFVDRLASAKSIFKQAYDDAVVLQTELSGEIDMKQKEIDNLKAVEKDTLKFISNIAHIVE